MSVYTGINAALAVGIPYILTFYFLLAFLEDSGYLNAVAFLTDRLMHKMGLHGRAAIPLVAGAGCNVPAIMGTRVLGTMRERIIASTLVVLTPCSARTAVILGAVSLTAGWRWALVIYAVTAVMAILTGVGMHHFMPGRGTGLVMEMFPFRRPGLGPVIQKTWNRFREFVVVATPIILGGSIVLGGLYETGLLWWFAIPLRPIMEGWLGLPAVAGLTLIVAVLRKELALQLLVTLAIAQYGLQAKNLLTFMRPDQIVVYALVNTLYVPCVATISILARELGWWVVVADGRSHLATRERFPEADEVRQLIQRTVEAIDYSDNLREPNWASWDLTASDVGSSGRGDFLTDTNLPPNFYWVKTADYTHSGFDRGHMCPSADRTDNVTDNDLVFRMSNIVPQAPDNNQGPWENLETYCRTLAQAGNELLIICGPNGFTGARINTNGPVLIPSYTWKIAVVVTNGTDMAVDRITTLTRVIAVNVPNIAGIRSIPWTNYLVSVNQIQTNTGFTFFTALPAYVASVLRAKIDGQPTPVVAPPLSVSITNEHDIIFSWPVAATGFVLQQNGNLNTTNWTTYGGTVSSNATTITVTIPSPAGNNFFRLIYQ